MTDAVQGERVWTLRFYQDKGGVRDVSVVDGPCLTGNSTIEVVPASEVELLRQALRFYAVYTNSTDGNLDAGLRARRALDPGAFDQERQGV